MDTERIKYLSCPLCSSVDFSPFMAGDCTKHPSYNPKLSPRVLWNKCAGCAHEFTEGYYSDAALEIVFSTTVANQGVGENIENNRSASARMLEKVLPFEDNGIWLDVGFGNGSLVFTAAEYGFETVGLDLRQQAVTAMKQLGFEAHKADICDFSYGKAFSVISMADVLEHTPFPLLCLESAKRLLKHGGVLFLSMPNSECLAWEIGTKQKLNPYWGELEHYHNFSRSRLYKLLEGLDFVPKRYGISERYRMGMEVVAVLE